MLSCFPSLPESPYECQQEKGRSGSSLIRNHTASLQRIEAEETSAECGSNASSAFTRREAALSAAKEALAEREAEHKAHIAEEKKKLDRPKQQLIRKERSLLRRRKRSMRGLPY